MRYQEARGRLRIAFTPRRKTALGGMLVGAVLSLLLVATPLLLLGGSGVDSNSMTEATPLAALATAPIEPGHFDISAVILDEPVADRKSQPHTFDTVGLGGEKSFEYQIQVFFFDPYTIVRKGDVDKIIISLGGHGEPPSFRHGVTGVGDQV